MKHCSSGKNLLMAKKLSDPFDVVHVDSHADLGLGDASWSFFCKKCVLQFRLIREEKISEYEFCDKIIKKN